MSSINIINYFTLIVNTAERTHTINQEINKHALPISITKSREVSISIQLFLLMLHRRFANAMQVSFCKSYRWKLENMKSKPNQGSGRISG